MSEVLTDAIRYWELRRIPYNATLLLIVAVIFFVNSPCSRFGRTLHIALPTWSTSRSKRQHSARHGDGTAGCCLELVCSLRASSRTFLLRRCSPMRPNIPLNADALLWPQCGLAPAGQLWR